MAFIDINNVRIAGIGVGVPATIVKSGDSNVSTSDYDTEAYIKSTGIEQRHVDEHNCTSDLCVAAAEQLLQDLGWDRSDIDGILFVSQTADYILPATACIIQDRLGLSSGCYAADVSMGCSGWVYGMSMAASLISAQGLKRVLVMAGDARARCGGRDPLFGSAGSVTALEYDVEAAPLHFDFGTDGSGYDAIIIPDGGCRNGITAESFVEDPAYGRPCNRLTTRMRGMDVFAFGISAAPKSVKRLAEHIGCSHLDFDYYIFHQANLKMNTQIARKLKLEPGKVPMSLPQFGNTSSASIPLTIATQLRGKLADGSRLLACGFGVGLSWGSLAFITNNLVLSDLTFKI